MYNEKAKKSETITHTYIKYTFDPDNKMLIWKKVESTSMPEINKVTHLTGRKYFVVVPGKHAYPEQQESVMKMFMDFYLEKLKKASDEVGKSATSIELLCSFLREKKCPSNEE